MSAAEIVSSRVAAPIPAHAGIGLRSEHYREVTETPPPVAWFEVHSENFFGEGGAPLKYMERVRQNYPVSFHGVGLSLGSCDELNRRHLKQLKSLIDRFEPGLVSDHLSWSSVDGNYVNDLLPLPYTDEALKLFIRHVEQTQEFLGREILVENPSSYLRYAHSPIAEWDFLSQVANSSGCGILLDVNNIYVSATNHGFDALHYLRSLPRSKIMEIHLAGFTIKRYPEGDILIDTHNTLVSEEVWALYREAIDRFGAIPTLIEWDKDLPPLQVLLEEAHRAEGILEDAHALVA